MRPGVGVDAVLGDRLGTRAGLAGDHAGVGEPRRLLRRRGELGGELAEGQVLALLADQAEAGDVPERGRAAVAEDDLVAVGQVEEGGQALAHAADGLLHRGLAVGRAHQPVAGRGEGVEVAGLDLGRTRSEAAVGREELGGDLEGVGHGGTSRGDERSVLTTLSESPYPDIRQHATHDGGLHDGHGPAHRAGPDHAPRRAAPGRGRAGGVRRPLRRPRRVADRPADVRRTPAASSSSATSTACRWPPGRGGAARSWRSAPSVTAEVKRMYVVPARQRRGIARRMLAHLEAHRRGRRDRGAGAGDGPRAAGGDRALHVVRLRAGPGLRLLLRLRRSAAPSAGGSGPPCGAAAQHHVGTPRRSRRRPPTAASP